MNPLDDLTVCITSFRRPTYLARALRTCVIAGVRRIAIAAVSPCDVTRHIINAGRSYGGWSSYDVSYVDQDIGCNASWLVACYRARTDRVLVLHDDDGLNASFGEIYGSLIAPFLNHGAGFAVWQGEHRHDTGDSSPCPFWKRPTGVIPSEELLEIVAARGRLSLSPVVAVLDRGTVIDACKEAEQTLRSNASLYTPGMLLGTEIVVYLRHIERFKKMLHVDEVLSFYGVHEESGTIAVEKTGDLSPLTVGYDIARDQGARAAPRLKPRVILAYSDASPADADEQLRFDAAYSSWRWLFGTGEVVELPIEDEDVRTFAGDHRPAPYVRDLLDVAARHARPGDVILLVNRDCGLTAYAPRRIVNNVRAHGGATVCFRRELTPAPGALYHSVKNCKTDGGFDAVAVTPSWWAQHRDKMPDMLLGREGWDTIFRTLVEEVLRGHPARCISQAGFTENPAYTDDAVYHAPHVPVWRCSPDGAGNRHNRALAASFLEERGLFLQAPTPPPAYP